MNTYSKSGWVNAKSTGKKDQIQGIMYNAKPLKDELNTIKKNYCKAMEIIDDLKKIKDINE